MSEFALPGLWLPPKRELVLPKLRLPKWTRPFQTADELISKAVTVDQGSLGTSNGTNQISHSYVTTAAVASGALIVVGVGRFNATNTTLSASGGSLTWTATPSTGVTNGSYRVYLFWALAPSGLASGSTITITGSSGGNDFTVAGLSYLGVDTVGTAVASATGTGAATAWGAGVVAGNAGDLYCSVAAGDAGASRTSTPTSPAVERIDFFGATSGGSLTMADKLSGSASDSVAGTWSGNTTHGSVCIAFKAAAAGGGATFRQRKTLLGVGR